MKAKGPGGRNRKSPSSPRTYLSCRGPKVLHSLLTWSSEGDPQHDFSAIPMDTRSFRDVRGREVGKADRTGQWPPAQLEDLASTTCLETEPTVCPRPVDLYSSGQNPRCSQRSRGDRVRSGEWSLRPSVSFWLARKDDAGRGKFL